MANNAVKRELSNRGPRKPPMPLQPVAQLKKVLPLALRPVAPLKKDPPLPPMTLRPVAQLKKNLPLPPMTLRPLAKLKKDVPLPPKIDYIKKNVEDAKKFVAKKNKKPAVIATCFGERIVKEKHDMLFPLGTKPDYTQRSGDQETEGCFESWMTPNFWRPDYTEIWVKEVEAEVGDGTPGSWMKPYNPELFQRDDDNEGGDGKPGFWMMPDNTEEVYQRGEDEQSEECDVQQYIYQEDPVNFDNNRYEVVTYNSTKSLNDLTAPRHLFYAERQQLLRDLKDKWESTVVMLQSLPYPANTRSQFLRNKQLAAELRLLATDIEELEYHPAMYIRDEFDSESVGKSSSQEE